MWLTLSIGTETEIFYGVARRSCTFYNTFTKLVAKLFQEGQQLLILRSREYSYDMRVCMLNSYYYLKA